MRAAPKSPSLVPGSVAAGAVFWVRIPGEETAMKGFKQFLLRGNVVDLAVGVVIGAAFGAVVTA